MISEGLIDELGSILKEDHQIELLKKDLSVFANDLVGYFDLLAKLDFEQKNDNKEGFNPVLRPTAL